MNSSPENMNLEGLIADNWDDSAVTPGIVLLLESYRAEIECNAAAFDPTVRSWQDHRPSVWAPVPSDVYNMVDRLWANKESSQTEIAPVSRWVLREGEPDIDNPEGVDLRVADRFELADLVCAGVVAPSFRCAGCDGLVARIVFPPRCLRHRYIAGVGISVLLPMGIANIEGPTAPWKVSVQRYPESAQELGAVPLAALATEVTQRGAFVVFDAPMDLGMLKDGPRHMDPAMFFLLVLKNGPSARAIR